MADSKTYLNVPFAQKDAAKALGAKWDAVNKKWYVPADKEISLFAKWRTESALLKSPAASHRSKSRASTAKSSASASNAVFGANTPAADKNFVAYDGDEPPWD